MKEEALVLLSGGMDSATCAFIAAEQYDVSTIFFKYGQRTESIEEQAFNQLSNKLNAKRRFVVELPFYATIGGSALTDKNIDVPDSEEEGVIPPTYVPFRNGVMLSIASAHAEVLGIHNIFIGAVWEDSSGYPDCREEFLVQLEKGINLGMRPESAVKIHFPVIHMTKSEIIQKGIELGLPFEYTWSCYCEGEKPCGKCPSCILRTRAFENLGMIDPLLK